MATGPFWGSVSNDDVGDMVPRLLESNGYNLKQVGHICMHVLCDALPGTWSSMVYGSLQMCVK